MRKRLRLIDQVRGACDKKCLFGKHHRTGKDRQVFRPVVSDHESAYGCGGAGKSHCAAKLALRRFDALDLADVFIARRVEESFSIEGIAKY